MKNIKIDWQVNGGLGYLFNDINNIEDFVKIELINIKKANSLIVPTFITDSSFKLQKFLKLVKKRIFFEEKDVCFIEKNNKIKLILAKNIKKNDKLLSDIFVLHNIPAIHIEGGFITNKGTHKLEYLTDLNQENLINFEKSFSKFSRNFTIFLTIAPELFIKKMNKDENIKLQNLDKKDIDLRVNIFKTFVNSLKENNIEIRLLAGHTKVEKDEFYKIQKLLGEYKYIGITHFHNAMVEGHFSQNIEGLPSYCMENNDIKYIGLIADNQHTNQGELLPTLINLYDRIILTSDAARPSCCKINGNKFYEMAQIPAILIKEKGENPLFCWIDFEKNEEIFNNILKHLKEKNIKKYDDILMELIKIYKNIGNHNGKIFGYKTLAGSGVNLQECCNFLIKLRENKEIIYKELEKTLQNKKAKKFLFFGLNKYKNLNTLNKNIYSNEDKIYLCDFIQNLLKNVILTNSELEKMTFLRVNSILKVDNLQYISNIKNKNFSVILKENINKVSEKDLKFFLNNLAKKIKNLINSLKTT